MSLANPNASLAPEAQTSETCPGASHVPSGARPPSAARDRQCPHHETYGFLATLRQTQPLSGSFQPQPGVSMLLTIGSRQQVERVSQPLLALRLFARILIAQKDRECPLEVCASLGTSLLGTFALPSVL